MSEFMVFCFLLVCLLALYFAIFKIKVFNLPPSPNYDQRGKIAAAPSRKIAAAPSRSVASAAKTGRSFDRDRWPFVFYFLAILGSFLSVLVLIFRPVVISTLNVAYDYRIIVGVTISASLVVASLFILAFGRIIEVLQQIRDK